MTDARTAARAAPDGDQALDFEETEGLAERLAADAVLLEHGGLRRQAVAGLRPRLTMSRTMSRATVSDVFRARVKALPAGALDDSAMPDRRRPPLPNRGCVGGTARTFATRRGYRSTP